MSDSKDMCTSDSNESPKCVNRTALSKLFQNAASLTLEKFMSKIKFSMFKQKYPEIYKHDPSFLENIYVQLKSQLQDKIEANMKNCFVEQHLFQKLEDLDDLIEEANKNPEEISWRPSGDPNEDIRDHRCKEKLRHKMALEIILKSCNNDIQQAENKAKENHKEILEMQQEVLQLNQQNNKVMELLGASRIPNIEEFHSIAEENC